METSTEKTRLLKGGFVLVAILSAYFAVRIFSEIKKDDMLGESQAPATITFSGHGEVKAPPDIANISFTISKDAKTTTDAQDAVSVIEKKALGVLKDKKIADKDIKTDNISSYPKHEYRQAVCPSIPEGVGYAGVTVSPTSPYYCPPSKDVIVGYTATESITVKIYNTADVGAIVQGLGSVGVTNLSGPNFAIDNEDGLKTQARKLAIDDAKAKAKVLARDLGVSLGKIASFNEAGNNYPIAYATSALMDKAGAAPAPAVIPKGENTISSDVSITYEIR